MLVQSNGLQAQRGRRSKCVGDHPLICLVEANRDQIDVPAASFVVNQPIFFGGTERDPTSIPAEYIGVIKALCPNHTIKVFDTGHWVLHERPAEVNDELKKWLDGLQLESPAKSNL